MRGFSSASPLLLFIISYILFRNADKCFDIIDSHGRFTLCQNRMPSNQMRANGIDRYAQACPNSKSPEQYDIRFADSVSKKSFPEKPSSAP